MMEVMVEEIFLPQSSDDFLFYGSSFSMGTMRDHKTGRANHYSPLEARITV